MSEVKEEMPGRAEKIAAIRTHTFIKEEGTRFIHLLGHLAQGWSKSDLAMVEGTSKLLNSLAQG